MATIQRVVAAHFGVSVAALVSRERQVKVMLPRQVAMALCRELAGASFADIAQAFGQSNPPAVKYAIDSIGDRAETEPKFLVAYERVCAEARAALGQIDLVTEGTESRSESTEKPLRALLPTSVTSVSQSA